MCKIFSLGVAWLQAISSISKTQLRCREIRCNLSPWLQLVSWAAICQGSRNLQSSAHLPVWLQQFQPSALCQLSCTHSAQLQPINSAFDLTGPAVFCQLTCNLSVLLYSVIQWCSALFFSQSVWEAALLGRCQVQWCWCFVDYRQ